MITPRLPNTAPEWLRDGYQHIWMPYTQMQTAPPPVPVTRTEGVRLTLADGRELIDGTASWWTACHGYNHPHIVAAMQKQVTEMPHVMFGGLAHEPAFRLATRLAALTPGDLDRVFFAEGGSVAVEVAMKMALQYFINRGQEGRSKFVSFYGGYHGDTFAAMSVCDPADGMHTLFKDAMPANFVTALPETREQRDAFHLFMDENTHHIAAVIVEPLVQGAGGMKFHDPAVLACLREACDRTGALLIFDEIFTGFGRTGALFAASAANVIPDIMCVGKALTGGTTPLSAAIAREHVFEAFLGDDPRAALMHGPTFMANPLACAAANAALDLFEQQPWQEDVARIEAQMRRELEPCRSLPGVLDVRVMGAIAAIQLSDLSDKETLKARFMEEGVWLRPFGDIVYLTPPFIIGEQDLRRLTDAIVRVLGDRQTP